ncbi:MAG: SDR family NAD(P)-dependent oxidoreductase [Methylobacteriaceae bacterium]|nr:SDR family NAD(P)-dependent oxidoreductase [Methylobacteriaceae bacterium]
MADRMQLRGRTAVITGAASGIGRAVAQCLARRGCHLALADVNEAGLEETARSCATGTRISYHGLDVSEREAIAAFPDVVRSAHPRIDLLVNNAGVALGGTFDQVAEPISTGLSRSISSALCG